ncbi:MAG: DUF3426 domain-containing protein [Alcaligenaceae bacterium]|nr:DUF3426 domain-containing protein [Alcaligenaceae bacterium]
MKTRCPSCETSLNVTPSQLKARGGRVRCGVCHSVFNALDYAVASAHGKPQKSSRRTDSRREAIYDERDAYDGEPYYDERDDDRLYQDEPFLEDSRDYDDRYDRIRHDDYDDYYSDYRRKRRGGGVIWVLLSFILLIALVLQGAVVFRNQIAHYFPSSRLALTQLCAIANCELGGTRSIDQFSLQNISLNVRSDVPAQDSQTALILQAKLINKENRPGDWPSLILSLKDERGQVDRQRIIKPEDYLVSELRVQPMAALSEYPILLRLTLAGAMATGYELKPYYEE